MHSVRPRPICRARNTFSPSIALWQHFIAPGQHATQRPSLFATKAAESHDDRDVDTGRLTSRARAPKQIRWMQNSKRRRTAWVERSGLKDINDGTAERALPGLGGETGSDLDMLLKKTYESFDTGEAYEGVVVKPIYSPPVDERTYPWLPSKQNPKESAEERLNLEIKKFHDFIQPNQAENVARKHLIEQTRTHVRQILPNYVLEVFGSERTGMAFAGSDIDLRLIPQESLADAARSKLPPSPEERFRRREDLRKLHWHLRRRHKWIYLMPTLRWARYPLISLQDRLSGLDVQLVLSNDTSTSRGYIQRYIKEYPFLPETYSVIKAALDIRGLTDVFRGGLGSYSLFMMIVASIIHKPHKSNNAAGALENFLRFWSRFRVKAHGVSIDPPEFFAKSEQVLMHERAMNHIKAEKVKRLPDWIPTIRDPADETNDLGRKVVAWRHIQMTVRAMLRDLCTGMKLNKDVSLIAGMVGPIYALQREHRKKLSEYGQSLVDAAEVTAKKGAQVHSNSSPEPSPESSLDLAHLAAIAQAIREDGTTNKQPAGEAEATDNKTGEEDGINPWLKDVRGDV